MNENGHHQQTIIKYQSWLPLVIKHGSWKSQNQWEIHWKVTYKLKNSPIFPQVFPVFFPVIPVFSQFFPCLSQFFPCLIPCVSWVFLSFSLCFIFSQRFPHGFRPPVHIAGGPHGRRAAAAIAHGRRAALHREAHLAVPRDLRGWIWHDTKWGPQDSEVGL